MKRKFSILMLVLVGLLALIVFRSSRQNGAQNENFQEKETPVVNDSFADARTENNEASPLPSPLDEGNTPIRRVPGKPVPDEVTHAALYGAKARVTLHVVDSKGNDVSGAEVTGSFAGTKNPAELYKEMTGPDGRVTLDAVHAGYMVNFTVRKDNYYDTRTEHHFNRRGWICVKDGRWIPWNSTLEVVLKEKRKPIPMYAKRIESKMPVHNLPVGYDFARGDWVMPYGQGERSDMVLAYSEAPEMNTWERYDFVITFSNKLDGAYLRKKDTYSQFVSAHEANPDGYQSAFAFVYERTDDKIIQDKRITEDDILVFRVRTKADESGNITEAYYGKIYGPFKFADGPQRFIRFTYYFNPNPNDRNLEFDGKNNLFNPKWNDSWNTNVP